MSPSDEMALALNRHFIGFFLQSGTLARQSLAGGSPREVLEDIHWADWSPDGKTLAIVHDVAGANRLEFPAGTVLHQSAGWIANVRVSPDGQHVAFLDHPARAGDQGSVMIAGLDGRIAARADKWDSIQGLAWPPGGREVWFTGTYTGGARALYALSLSGKVRLLARVPDALRLEDVSRGGRVLLVRDYLHLGIMALAPGAKVPADLSWMDYSALRGLTRDGTRASLRRNRRWRRSYRGNLLPQDGRLAAGRSGRRHLRRSVAGRQMGVRIVVADAISGSALGGRTHRTRFAPATSPARPHGAMGQLASRWQARPAGRERARPWRASLSRGPRPGQRTTHLARRSEPLPYVNNVSPDGKFVAAMGPDSTFALYALDGSGSRPIPGLERGDVPSTFTADGASLYVYRPGELPAKVYRLNLSTGRKQLWKELMPSDPAGIYYIRPPHFSQDGNAYAYSYARLLSDLYVVDGLK
jgi:eukaryotic-like serine/threonine-protein kinase